MQEKLKKDLRLIGIVFLAVFLFFIIAKLINMPKITGSNKLIKMHKIDQIEERVSNQMLVAVLAVDFYAMEIIGNIF